MSSTALDLCSHCAQPVPPGLMNPQAGLQFCCAACETVHAALKECNLEAYYRLRARSAAELQPARRTGKSYREYDDPAYHALHVRAQGDGTLRTTFMLEGVHCAACAWLVEKLPQLVPGVRESILDLGKSQACVTWSGPARLSGIAQQLDRLGYPPHPARGTKARELHLQEERRQLIHVGVAGALAGNIMLVAFALYLGMFDAMDAAHTQLFRGLSMVLGATSLLWPGRVFFKGAYNALRARTPHLDIPIALGLGAGGIAGVINTLSGQGEIYFDSLGVLVFLLLGGRLIQRRQQARAEDALNLLFSITPTSARRITDSGSEDVPIEALLRGDIVEVRAFESVPVDGCIVGGHSTLNKALLTGESLPQPCAPGESVSAGMTNLSATLRVRVEATGAETRAGRLMELVAQAIRRRAPLVLFANRISVVFTVVTLVLAGLTYAAWYATDPMRALDHAVALLIVACPCALGLATPLAVSVALGRAAQRGILIKNGEALETLAGRGTIFLDKTGTLTEGRLRLVSWHGEDRARALAVALERHSAHPVARALVEAWGSDVRTPGLPTEAASDVRQLSRGGIEGRIGRSQVWVGSVELARERKFRIADGYGAAIARCLDERQSPVVIALDGVVQGVAGIADPLRGDARAALERLQARGWRVAILSGDHPEIVRQAGRELGLPAEALHGGLSPEEKLAHVEGALRSGRVAMVGDGVNDAAALAAASVGISVHGGAEASLAAAPVYLGKPGLASIVELVDASRKTVRVVRRCLGASLFYNAIAVGLAATGCINPLIAAILMPLSSTTVLSLALGARTFEEQQP